MDAAGRALVTGASRGIGLATACELARRGFEVVAGMRDPERGPSLEAAGAITAVRLDVTDPGTVEAAIPDGLRVLVNNAGVECAYLPVEHTPIAQWREVFETNVFGLADVTRRAVPSMRAAGGGVVCNITTSSLLVPVPFYGVYRASKAAVAAMGESLRAKLAPFGIRVIEVLPGPIRTDMLASSDREFEAAQYEGYEAMAAAMRAGRHSIESYVTDVDVAASAIVDAIVSADDRLRWTCDPLGAELLGGARPFGSREG